MGLVSLQRVQALFRAHGLLFESALSILLILFLTSCGKVQRGSNHPISNDHAQRSLENRLKKTDEVRAQMDLIHEALRPVEAILTDMSHAVNSKVTIDGRPAERFKGGVGRLRTVLKESTKGIVQYKADGSWLIERNVTLPLGRSNYACQTSQIQILGKRVADHDELALNLKDCASVDRMTLVEVKSYSDHIEVSYSPETLDQLIRTDFKKDDCILRIRKHETEIVCEQIYLHADSFTAIVQPFYFSHTSSGIDAVIRMIARNKASELIAQVDLEAHPGHPTQIVVSTEE